MTDDRLRTLVPPDLRRFVDSEGAPGFFEWCEATGDKIAEAKTPEEEALAWLLRAVTTAVIETGNRLESRGIPQEIITVMLPRACAIAAAGGLVSVLKDDTPTKFVERMIVGEARFAVKVLCPGRTIGAAQPEASDDGA